MRGRDAPRCCLPGRRLVLAAGARLGRAGRQRHGPGIPMPVPAGAERAEPRGPPRAAGAGRAGGSRALLRELFRGSAWVMPLQVPYRDSPQQWLFIFLRRFDPCQAFFQKLLPTFCEYRVGLGFTQRASAQSRVQPLLVMLLHAPVYLCSLLFFLHIKG